MELIASPCSWSSVKVLSITWCPVCWRDMFHKDLSTATESAAPCQPREKWCTSQKQREFIFDLPRPLPPKVRDTTASNNSPPPSPKGWTCPCGCTWGRNKSNWTVHQWHFRQSETSSSLFSSNCVPPFSCFFFFSLLTEIFWPWRNSQPQELVMRVFWQRAHPVGNVMFV